MQISTTTSKQAIDNAVLFKAQYILIDAGWYGSEYNESSDATSWLPQPKKDLFDLIQIIEYGKSKGIGVFLYVNDIALKKQVHEIAPLYSKWGVKGVKFGFVNLVDSQDVERILNYVKIFYNYKLLVNIHDNYRPSGISTTMRNLLSIEGIQGDEHGPNSLHSLYLPFLRYIAGEADHTFVYDKERLKKMGKTPMHQCALPIILYSPLQHLFWYQSQPEILRLFEHIESDYPNLQIWKDLPTTWKKTVPLGGEVGKWISIAREKGDGSWFIATICHEEVKKIPITLDFLSENQNQGWNILRYRDRYDDPYSPSIVEKLTAKSGDTLFVSLLNSGGEVLILTRQ